MKITSPNGYLIVQLNIIILTVSIVNAAVLNFGVNTGIWGFQMETGKLTDNNISVLLDDIKNQFNQANLKNDENRPQVAIEDTNNGDRITIRHNNICYEYFVDTKSNMIKRVEGFEKIIANDVNSLNVKEIDDGKMAVTISSNGNGSGNNGTSEQSYSTVIEKGMNT